MKKSKANRNTLAALIRCEPLIEKKLAIARGQSLFVDNASGKLDRMRIVEVWQNYAAYLHRNPTPESDPTPHLKGYHSYMHKLIADEKTHLGEMLSAAIMQNDFAVFADLATIIQWEKTPDANKEYVSLLLFCYSRKRGTPDRPVDGKALAGYMRSSGFPYDGYENCVPDGLRKLCKRLGISIGAP